MVRAIKVFKSYLKNSVQTTMVTSPWNVLEQISKALFCFNSFSTSEGYIVDRTLICLPVGSGWQVSSTASYRLQTMFVDVSKHKPNRSNTLEYSDGCRRARTSSPLISVIAHDGSPRIKTIILQVFIQI